MWFEFMLFTFEIDVNDLAIKDSGSKAYHNVKG